MIRIRRALAGWVLLIGVFVVANLTALATEKDIPVSKVPKKVLVAAEKAVPGVVFREAEVKKTSQGLVYELDGYVGKQKYEITVTASAKVLRVRKETEDESDEKDDPEDED